MDTAELISKVVVLDLTLLTTSELTRVPTSSSPNSKTSLTLTSDPLTGGAELTSKVVVPVSTRLTTSEQTKAPTSSSLSERVSLMKFKVDEIY